MKWINLKENPPLQKKGFVLGCDWYIGEKESDYRIAACELPIFESYWCGIPNGAALNVFDSICPAIGHGYNAHWMEIPRDDRWIKFDADNYPYQRELHEVLIKLKNGDFYTGFIELYHLFPSWCPSFNMMKHYWLDDIEAWRELPPSPPFVKKPPETEEEKRISEEWIKSFKYGRVD
jgi:hypothetical protein